MAVRNTFNAAAAEQALIAMGRQALIDIGWQAVARIDARCPVDTGFMRSTIDMVDTGSPDSVKIVCTAHYSVYVEFGHWDGRGNRGLVPPNPFFRNGLLDVAADYGHRIDTISVNSLYDRRSGASGHELIFTGDTGTAL